MTFASPGYFFILGALLPACAAFILYWLTWRSEARRRFGGIATEPPLTRATLLLSPALIVLSIVFACVAAARPQWGNQTEQVEQQGIDLVIVLDVSNSMLSTDAEPSRIGRAQVQINALLDEMAGDRVGLVIFAGEPFVRSPVTSDLTALQRLVEGVDGERGLLLPGSNLGAAILTANRMLERGDAARSRAILVISDGEDHGTSLSSAVAAANSDGTRVFTAGVGTGEGAPVLDPDPITGQPIIRIGPDGQPVITRLYEDALRSVAGTAGGRYIAMSRDGTELASLAGEFDELAATRFGAEESSQKLERFQIFAAVALLFADLELLLLAMPRGSRSGAGRLAKLWPAAASTIFIAALCSTTVADINEDGNSEYNRGQYEAALDLYRTAQAGDAAPELSYNAANALERLAQYDEAVEEALKARGNSTGDDGRDSQIEYGLGNHYVGAGNLFAAIEAYKRSLLANPGDGDAKHNLEVATRRLTPTASPTPPSIEATPTAGSSQPGQQPNEPSDFTPGDPGEEPGGTPAPDEPAQDTSELSQEELQRLLEEALAGIEREFTQEEAERILELLREENRRSVEDSADVPGIGGLPDY